MKRVDVLPERAVPGVRAERLGLVFAGLPLAVRAVLPVGQGNADAILLSSKNSCTSASSAGRSLLLVAVMGVVAPAGGLPRRALTPLPGVDALGVVGAFAGAADGPDDDAHMATEPNKKYRKGWVFWMSVSQM